MAKTITSQEPYVISVALIQLKLNAPQASTSVNDHCSTENADHALDPGLSRWRSFNKGNNSTR
ncbi:unnamed protein product [Amoebophrya sp. A25]|nr:unnamed protein product [Amoebophrya sp. A25]|eukprot:GSA25T00019880001.1